MVDIGSFAGSTVKPYTRLVRFLKNRGLELPQLDRCRSVADVLQVCRGTYLTGGVEDLRALPAAFVDLSFSQAVLEHVRKHELEETLRQLWRITKPGGLTSHEVDLRDHLGGALNNLRFREEVWESDWFAGAGFYTNRIRYGSILEVFRRAGWDILTTEAQSWRSLPTPRRALDGMFRGLPKSDLLVSVSYIVARRS